MKFDGYDYTVLQGWMYADLTNGRMVKGAFVNGPLSPTGGYPLAIQEGWNVEESNKYVDPSAQYKPIEGDAISSVPPSGAPTPTPSPEPAPPGTGPADPVPSNVYLGPFTSVTGDPIPVSDFTNHQGATLKAPAREDVVFCAPLPLDQHYGSCNFQGYPYYPSDIFGSISNTMGDLSSARRVDGVNGGDIHLGDFTVDTSRQAYVNWRVVIFQGQGGQSSVKWGP